MKLLITRGLSGEFLGGAEIEIIDLVNTLEGSNFEILLVTNSPELAKSVGVKSKVIEEWPSRQEGQLLYLKGLAKLKKELGKVVVGFNPDLILSESREDYIALSNSDAPVVLRDHADLKHLLIKGRSNPFSVAFQKYYLSKLRKAAAILTVNKHERSYIQGYLPDVEVRVMHSGIDFEKFPKSVRVPNEAALNIGVVSRLVRDKGLDYFLEAITELSDNVTSKSVFSITGDGNYRQELEDKTKSLGVNVEFVGYTDNPGETYEKLDILVQPSEYEGWSRTVSEGMYYGCPIIASDIDSHKEQLANDSGLLFNSKDSEALARKISELAKDKGLRAKLSGNAQKRVVQTSDINTITDKVFIPLAEELTK